jgi:glycosyltransferase involved in cell wall biosynthesis
VALLSWLPGNLKHIWREIHNADAVHAPVPGDIGTLGILVALLQRKPLFVRHCGTWGEPVTLADRFLIQLLECLNGKRHVVMATGGGDIPPPSRNPEIDWIFSTTLSEKEVTTLPVPKPWRSGQPLRLATASRLSPNKNTAAVLRGLALVKKQFPFVKLDVLGNGACLGELRALASGLDIAEAVTFHGNVSHEEVLRVLSKAHLFVFPTRLKEGFPKAVLEALACGLPVIATAVSVIPHLIGGCAGVLLDRPDPTEVAEAVLQLLNDEKRFIEMSACARQTSRAYTLERWRDEIGRRLRNHWGPLRRDGVEPTRISAAI